MKVGDRFRTAGDGKIRDGRVMICSSDARSATLMLDDGLMLPIVRESNGKYRTVFGGYNVTPSGPEQ